MKLNKEFVKLAAFFGISFLILFFTPKSSYANDFSISIYPSIIQISSLPPANIIAPLEIRNLSDQNIETEIQIKQFHSLSENQIPEYSEDSDDIIKNVKIIDNGTETKSLFLAPKQTKKLSVEINIPKQEKQGDHYFSIQFISKDNKNIMGTNSSQILGGVTTNILLSVGRIENKIRAQFSSPQIILNQDSIPFKILIKNDGRNYAPVQGTIVIKNLFSIPVDKIDLGKRNVLNNSSLYLNQAFKHNFMIGYYKATLSLYAVKTNETILKTISFIVIPIKTISIIILALATIILIYKRVKKKLDEQ